MKNSYCYVQTCYQIISGRNLRYRRALQIVQSEEYLNAADTEIIPIHRHHRAKRQTAISIPVTAKEYCEGTAPSTTISTSNGWFFTCRARLNTCASASADFASNPCCITIVTGQTQYCGTSTSTFLTECLAFIVAQHSTTPSTTICAIYAASTATTSDSSSSSSSSSSSETTTRNEEETLFNETIGALVLALAISAVVIAINPSLPLMTDSLIPPGSPAPGSRSGGALPFGTTSSVIALVPPSLIPISAFPPFVTPRTFGAESIIFAEDPSILSLTVKRSIWKNHRRFKLPFVNIFKKLVNNFKCLRTRLTAFGRSNMIENMRRRTSYMPRYHFRRRMDDNINSIDDCIDGIEEPLYGFRTNITLLRDSPCILGYTCDNPSTSGRENFCLYRVAQTNLTI